MLECLFLICTEATGPLGIWSKSLFGLIVKLLHFPIRSHNFKVHNVYRQGSCFTFIVKLLYFTETISSLLLEFRQGNSRWRTSLLNHPLHRSRISTRPPFKTSILAEHKCHSRATLFSSCGVRRRTSLESYSKPPSLRSDVVFARKRLAARATRLGRENNMSHYGSMSLRRGDDRQRAAFSNSISLPRPAAEVWDGAETSGHTLLAPFNTQRRPLRWPPRTSSTSQAHCLSP